MTAAQLSAFQAGAGIPPPTMLTAIAAMTLTLTFIWVIWLTWGFFRAWQSGQATLFELTWGVVRACMVLMVLGFYLR